MERGPRFPNEADRPMEAGMAGVLSDRELALVDAYWRAANYVSVGQIYLLDNPLLREPLELRHVKPRLLGHWGTTPGLNFVYVHLNRVIRKFELDTLYVCGPGHGGPAMVANTYLEGTYTEVYPHVTQDADGLRRLFRQFSFPGGIPSHVAPETPGSIHEGGELGYALAHAYGAAFDNPDLLVACVIGDGEAETGPLATAWHSNKFLNPKTDGAVLPILHLNGYKIANPTVLARISRSELESLLTGYGYRPCIVEGDEPGPMHQAMAAALDGIVEEIRAIQTAARTGGRTERPRWPALVLVTPKGWTGPAEVDGKKTEGFWRSHQVPLAGLAEKPEHLRQLERWMRSYRPEELFDGAGRFRPELTALAPRGARRMGATPSRQRRPPARGSPPAGRPALRRGRPLAGRRGRRGHPGPGALPARRHGGEPAAAELPGHESRRGGIEPAGCPLRDDRADLDGRAEAGGRAPGPERPGDGDPQRAHLPGMARGISPHGTARPLFELRGLHPRRRFDVQPARQVAEGDPGRSLGARRSPPSTTS